MNRMLAGVGMDVPMGPEAEGARRASESSWRRSSSVKLKRAFGQPVRIRVSL